MRSLMLVALSLASAPGLAADVFRSVAADGTVTYGDRPMNANAESVHIAVRRPEGTPSAPESTDTQPATKPPDQSADDYVDGMTNAQIAQRIVENCKLARTQLAVVENANGLSRTEPDGTMRELSDEEAAAVREQARAEVEEWCETD